MKFNFRLFSFLHPRPPGSFKAAFWVLVVAVIACNAVSSSAADLSQGVMLAVPVAQGPKINGSLKGWNLAAADPIWMSVSTAKKMNALAVLEYTQRALYFGVRVTLPDRKIYNPNGPLDTFWKGDELELRLVADPKVAYPINPGAANVKNNLRVAHMAFWKDTRNGKCYIHLAHGIKDSYRNNLIHLWLLWVDAIVPIPVKFVPNQS